VDQRDHRATKMNARPCCQADNRIRQPQLNRQGSADLHHEDRTVRQHDILTANSSARRGRDATTPAQAPTSCTTLGQSRWPRPRLPLPPLLLTENTDLVASPRAGHRPGCLNAWNHRSARPWCAHHHRRPRRTAQRLAAMTDGSWPRSASSGMTGQRQERLSTHRADQQRRARDYGS
jgi:hypothetical protein